VTKPELKRRIPLLSIKITTPESEKSLRKIEELYLRYLTETGQFGRVISDEIRSPYHMEIFTSEIHEYEYFWTGAISTVFMIATAGLLPSHYTEDRLITVDFYVSDKFVGRENYRQRHTTMFGLPFLVIWERGIKEARDIEFNKERNMINNLVKDYNRYL